MYDEKASKKAFKEGTPEIMSQIISLISDIEDFSVEKIPLYLLCYDADGLLCYDILFLINSHLLQLATSGLQH